MMGQILVLVARHYVAATVVAVDRVPYRLNKVRELGADVAIDALAESAVDSVADATGGKKANLVVVSPGSIAAIQTGLEAVATGETVCLFTPSGENERLPICPHDFWFRHITLRPATPAAPRHTGGNGPCQSGRGKGR